MKFTCDNCGAVKHRAKSKLDQREHHFCSKKCAGEYFGKGLYDAGKPNTLGRTSKSQIHLRNIRALKKMFD